ncbi:Zn-dependent hydrolase [Kaistia sp. MMO-174]|uniref:Zn-dependent hydrolase n=1 Tax=Kaistia sp. MMO-174 TaxID=3081256 RepID=UPI00301765C4
MSETLQQPRIDTARLVARIEALGRIGALPGGGACRLALDDDEKRGRDFLVAAMRDAGLEVVVDAIGNIFGTRAGRRTAPVVMLGSHIDTVATGGLYDGALGVLAGLEVLATLDDAGIETEYPITVAAFTNEEGARFAPDMLGSLVHVGGLDLDEALATRAIDGAILGQELQRIGYAGGDAGPRDIRAYFELHIEQGPILEDEAIDIGVVEGVQGISWTELTIEGRSAHAGTTPLRLRRDAGLAAARIATEVGAMVRAIGGDQVGTVGALTLSPNLVNVVAQKAVMTVDLRNPDEAILQQSEAALAESVARIGAEEQVTVERRALARFEPVAFDPILVDQVEDAAAALGLSSRRLYSGAGHDAQMIARIAPAAMIFVPSVGGISHNIQEFTRPDDLGNGANVLLRVALASADAIL